MRHEEQPPSWLGVATGFLLLLIIGGVLVLVWLTVNSGEDEAHDEGAAITAPRPQDQAAAWSLTSDATPALLRVLSDGGSRWPRESSL